MNKLGFYTQNFAHIIDPIQKVKPPVMLAHLTDRGMLRRIRAELSPQTFVIGRYHYDPGKQNEMLDNDDPEKVGRELAEFVLNDDFRFATQRDDNGQLIVNAWMTLNESLPGPNSSDWQAEESRQKIIERAAHYDLLQVAFLKRLREDVPDSEAIAFNFAAGNWMNGTDFIAHFPNTLDAYTYLGFHEYGWPHMNPEQTPHTQSSCGSYRLIMQAIREKYGPKHKVIITEAGLARMFKHVEDPPGDVGWLYADEGGQEVSEESYRQSLRWYNQFLNADEYVKGACLFMVGEDARWRTFRHIGQDNNEGDLTLMDMLRDLST